MTLHFASGVVSHSRVISNTHGQISSQHGGKIQTSHTTMFRLGGDLAEMAGAMNLNDGDDVAIAGPMTSRGIRGLALFERGSRRMRVAHTDRRKILAGIFLMMLGVAVQVMTVLGGRMPYGGTPLLLAGVFLIWLYEREISRVQEAVVTIYAHAPESGGLAAAAPAAESVSVGGGALHPSSPGSAAIPVLASAPARLLPGIARFFKVMSVLFVVYLLVETGAGLTYEGLLAVPVLAMEWLVAGAAAAALWVAGDWLLATAAFDAAPYQSA